MGLGLRVLRRPGRLKPVTIRDPIDKLLLQPFGVITTPQAERRDQFNRRNCQHPTAGKDLSRQNARSRPSKESILRSSAENSSACSAQTEPAKAPPSVCALRARCPPRAVSPLPASMWSSILSEARRYMGVVTQFNTLDRQCTVFENLYFHCRYFGIPHAESAKRADELLELFKLTERAKSSVRALSGGLAQRVQIARAVAHNPEVLFLDEPSAGLDPQTRLALWDIIRELRQRGTTIVSHHPLHGRGRPAVRPGRHHRPWKDPRKRHAGRTEEAASARSGYSSCNCRTPAPTVYAVASERFLASPRSKLLLPA